MSAVPNDWKGARAESDNGQDQTDETLPCSDWTELITSWEAALHWTEGLDIALSVMFASILSTESLGDQLWVKIIGPASCGKSTLCEGISTAKRYVMAKSTIRGFHSGYGDGDEDNSLIAKLHNMTLATKDGDTLLQSPNLGQILAEGRDVYDRVSRTHYRNRNSKSYEGVNLTWILCGTSSLRSIDSSELGERFLDCVIMDGIDDEMEDMILMKVAERAEKALNLTSNSDQRNDPDLDRATRMTGGYVNYLRENAIDILSAIDFPREGLLRCARLGKFVAYMRARPSKVQDEADDREFGARLVSQHVRLAKCLAATMGRSAVDDEVMSRVRKVALDTARGTTYHIAELLYRHPDGLSAKTVALYINSTEERTLTMLRFLRRIKATTLSAREEHGVRQAPAWNLTPTLRRLFYDVNHWT